MIVLNVTYKCKPGKREAFREMIRTEGIDEACRAEAGNIKYDYYFSTECNDELFLLEKWRDDEALVDHGKMPHIAKLKECKSEYVIETIIERYVVD